MFVTNDVDLFERVLTLSNHGRSRTQSKQFWSDVVGFKYKISNIQAAIGCAQMERIEDLVKRKRQIFKTYSQELSKLPSISMNLETDGIVNGAWMPTVVFAKKNAVSRERLKSIFASENIDARVFFYPLSSLPMFKAITSNVNAYSIPERSINLPSYHDISIEDQDRVISVIKKFTHN